MTEFEKWYALLEDDIEVRAELSLRAGSDSTLEEEAEIIAAMAGARGIHFTSEELLEDYRRREEERERARNAADVQELSDDELEKAAGGQVCRIGKIYWCGNLNKPYQDSYGNRRTPYFLLKGKYKMIRISTSSSAYAPMLIGTADDSPFPGSISARPNEIGWIERGWCDCV